MLSINSIDNHLVPDKDFDSPLCILIVCNEIDRIKMIKTYSSQILLIHSVAYINLNAFPLDWISLNEGTRSVVLMKCKVIFDLIKSNNSKIIDQARLALIILNFHPACDPTIYS